MKNKGWLNRRIQKAAATVESLPEWMQSHCQTEIRRLPMTTTKPTWIEGKPESAGCPGFFWVADEEGEKAIAEVDMDGNWKKPKGIGPVVAYSGPIVEPDDETLP